MHASHLKSPKLPAPAAASNGASATFGTESSAQLFQHKVPPTFQKQSELKRHRRLGVRNEKRGTSRAAQPARTPRHKGTQPTRTDAQHAHTQPPPAPTNPHPAGRQQARGQGPAKARGGEDAPWNPVFVPDPDAHGWRDASCNLCAVHKGESSSRGVPRSEGGRAMPLPTPPRARLGKLGWVGRGKTQRAKRGLLGPRYLQTRCL